MEREDSAGQGGRVLPPGPQGVLVQDSKDHSHNPDTALPSAGTHPIQTLAVWADHKIESVCVREIHVYTCGVRACMYLYINVQCRIVCKQPSWLSREEWLGAANMPIICPQKD